MKFLSESFLLEIYKLCFLRKEFLEIIVEHLKYQYIPDELIALKSILKSIISYYNVNNKLPSYGVVSQQHNSDREVQEYIAKIKTSTPGDINDLLEQLEKYIKTSKFQLLYKNIAEIYNKGKVEEAIEIAAKESEEIVKFSLKKNSSHSLKLFADFEKDQNEKQLKRELNEDVKDKMPTGITPLDEVMYGGLDKTDTLCFLGRSGTGKSTILKYIGVHSARMGYDVLHIQLEGTKKECFDKYTQVWTACKYNDVKFGNIKNEKYIKLIKKAKLLYNQKKEVHIHAFERFDEATCKDVRDLVVEHEKIYGKYPDLLIIDSIDLLHPGDGLRYGIDTNGIKMKKENSAKKIKNINAEFGCRIITVDQADNVQKEHWNNADWCMSRNNVSGAKNLPNSFSYFITQNTTEDEEKNNLTRLYIDKARYYLPKNRVIKIATNFDHGRYYDNKRTLELNLN